MAANGSRQARQKIPQPSRHSPYFACGTGRRTDQSAGALAAAAVRVASIACRLSYIGWMKPFLPLLSALAVAAACLSATPAAEAQSRQRCDNGTTVRFGEDAKAVARRCGVNVEALKLHNPGLRDLNRPAMTGTIVVPPRPALPTPTPRQRGNPAFAPVIIEVPGMR